ncbi:MAG: CapA family protein [Clostridia bacterium]|nr:CapA family protein [Clostridia bacterium]
MLMIDCAVLIAVIVLSDFARARLAPASSSEGESVTEEERESVPTEVPATENAESGRVRFFIGGDNLIHENVLNEANRLAGGSGSRSGYGSGFSFQPLYGDLADTIRTADLAVCNQASLVGGNDAPGALAGYPLFNSPSSLAEDLLALGFDAVNIGNNHLLDLGDHGLKQSLSVWKEKDVILLGGYESADEMRAVANKIHRVNGIKIAMLSYTATTNGLKSKENAPIPYYGDGGGGVSQDVLDQIGQCRRNADLVLVFVNWGNTESFEVGEEQKEAARRFAEAGADVILGTGPKVIQKIERILSADQERETLCVYSLGNFMGTMQYLDNLFGGALLFEAKKTEEGCRIENVLFQPLVIHYDERISSLGVYTLQNYPESLFSRHGSNLLYGKGRYSRYFEILQSLIPREFLPVSLRGSSFS